MFAKNETINPFDVESESLGSCYEVEAVQLRVTSK